MIQINCQPKHRELEASLEKEEVITRYFRNAQISQDYFQLLIRAFKKERSLELWIQENSNTRFMILKKYDFCAGSGDLGPKRVEGDRQIPEGIYEIDRFNPQSRFYLSLGLNYPNKSDSILGDQTKPGKDIFIHGKCRSVGCIAITDDKIKEVYTIARKAVRNGQSSIRVEIFPFDFSESSNQYLWHAAGYTKYRTFWKELRAIFLHFEEHKIPGPFGIDEQGHYFLVDHWK